jgi:hypothetical protein
MDPRRAIDGADHRDFNVEQIAQKTATIVKRQIPVAGSAKLETASVNLLALFVVRIFETVGGVD